MREGPVQQMAREAGSRRHKTVLQECADHIHSPRTPRDSPDKHSLPPKYFKHSPTLPDISAMPWQRARQPIVHLSRAGIASRDFFKFIYLFFF